MYVHTYSIHIACERSVHLSLPPPTPPPPMQSSVMTTFLISLNPPVLGAFLSSAMGKVRHDVLQPLLSWLYMLLFAEYSWSLHRLHDQQQFAESVEIQEVSLERIQLLETCRVQRTWSKIVLVAGLSHSPLLKATAVPAHVCASLRPRLPPQHGGKRLKEWCG